MEESLEGRLKETKEKIEKALEKDDDEILFYSRDLIFYTLVEVLYEDACAVRKGTIGQNVTGLENRKLRGTIISLECPLPEICYDVSGAINHFGEPRDLYQDYDKSLEILKNVLGSDLAIEIVEGKIVNSGVLINAVTHAKKKYEYEGRNEFTKLEARYLPERTGNEGSRTKSALAIALATNNKNGRVYMVTQTVKSEIGVGKLVEFSPDGVTREFHLKVTAKGGLKGIVIHYKYNSVEEEIQRYGEEEYIIFKAEEVIE